MKVKKVKSVLDTFNRRKSRNDIKNTEKLDKKDVVKLMLAVEQPYQDSEEDSKSPIKRF